MLNRQRTKEKFRILGSLGRGAFSTVFKVCRLADNEVYALKKVQLSNLKPKDIENALNEIRILASIKHPNVIGFREAYLEEDTRELCIVMDFAGGGDLAKKIRECRERRIRFPESLVVRFFYQLTSALLELHAHQVIHRDLKTANVFLTEDLRSLKLGDLNVSKIVKNRFAVTQTGTPFYASPEVWREEPYNEKTDIWSLGCVMYEVCMLRPPFNAADMDGLYAKVQDCEMEAFDSFYSAPLQATIRKCLDLNPSKRPSCERLLKSPLFGDLKTLLGEQSGATLEPIFSTSHLMDTIKHFDDLRDLSRRLPRPQYLSSEPDLPPRGDKRARLQAFFSRNQKKAAFSIKSSAKETKPRSKSLLFGGPKATLPVSARERIEGLLSRSRAPPSKAVVAVEIESIRKKLLKNSGNLASFVQEGALRSQTRVRGSGIGLSQLIIEHSRVLTPKLPPAELYRSEKRASSGVKVTRLATLEDLGRPAVPRSSNLLATSVLTKPDTSIRQPSKSPVRINRLQPRSLHRRER